MNDNYKHDFWCWEKIFSKSEIEKVNLVCEKNYETSFTDFSAVGVTKTAEVRGIFWGNIKSILNHIDDIWRHTNAEQFGYNLFNTSNNDLWNINTYDCKNHGNYDFHYDATHNHANDIKLTGILNISNQSYEGGEFIAFFGGKFQEIKELNKPGSSVLLNNKVLHKVNPVTKGIRKTISYWYKGPKFI